jgi:transcriptional regulator with XRE-family HTH domain
MRAFGEKLRQLRLAKGLPPGRLSRKCRVLPDTIRKIGEGRSEASLSMILILCDGLGVSPEALIGGLPVLQERREK